MANSQTLRRVNIGILSALLFLALLGFAGVTILTITAIEGSIEHSNQYRPEILVMAAMLSITVLAIGLVVCIALVAQIRRLWQPCRRIHG